MAWRLLERTPSSYPRWVQALPAYAIGILAAYWCIERAVELPL